MVALAGDEGGATVVLVLIVFALIVGDDAVAYVVVVGITGEMLAYPDGF